MPDQTAPALLQEIAAALALPPGAGARAVFAGDQHLASCFPVTELAAASIAAAGLALSDLAGLGPVTVDRRLASFWFGFSLRPEGWALPSPWDPIAGDYETRDGWIKLHTNARHHRAVALAVLRCGDGRAAVAEAVRQWAGDELEAAVVAAGGCAARLRSRAEWAAHPQGRAVAAEPLILWDGEGAGTTWRPAGPRPLSGLRVLDLTRVLAGPVATRFLAGYGAEVLRLDPPGWDEPGVVPEVTAGKRCARLDLKTAAGRTVFKRLLAGADVLIHGYRADALAALGFGASVRRAIGPGLVDVSLDAYGHQGPWACRRGFDSLVQFSTGIAAAGMEWRRASKPVSLPVQALDHATGYLIAAAALRALRLGGGRARLSLARTAKLLADQAGTPSEDNLTPESAEDLAPGIEATAWGPARRLRPPLTVEGAALGFTLPAAALGQHPPAWG
ncbi:CoA transferase [Zavarzinia sp.]|uniref:CoA transferase n=1 Tax=Zavarzinia sp. TaxID=2027920 RepID=UPI0035627019